jgi:adenosylhomocysteine nucleosidase
MALGSFVRILLQRLAAEQVQQTVADNLRKTAAPGEASATAEPSDDAAKSKLLPCHVGLVFALDMESGYLEDRLAGKIAVHGDGFTVRTGGLKGRGVAVIVTGHGRAAARRGAEALVAGHRPRWIISAGFAGGLSPQIARSDIVMAGAVLGEHGERLAIDLHLPQDGPSPKGVHVGPVLTLDHIVRTADEKKSLGERYGALAVDMESLAVAQLCQQEKLRFLAIRSITDAVDDELPRDVERLLNKNTLSKRLGAAAGSIVRRPSAAKDLWKLRENAITAASRLAKFLEGVITQLPD